MDNGHLAQLKAATKLSEEGFAVSMPVDPHCPYDLVVDNGRRLMRVQVKSCHSFVRGRYAVDISCGSENKKRPYADDAIDAFVVYLTKADAWYVLPIHRVLGQHRVSLYPHASTGKYAENRDAWALLR